MKHVGIILAAGSSSRMSQNKQLLTFQGKSLIQHLADKVSQLELKSLTCVTGYLDEELKENLSGYKVNFIHNKEYHLGMTVSLQCGIRYVMDTQSDHGIMVMLTDQPLIEASHYKSLLDAASSGKNMIVTTKYKDNYGAPTIFHPVLFPELLSLTSSHSPRNIIEKYHQSCMYIRHEHAAIDVDTDDDYQRLLDNRK